MQADIANLKRPPAGRTSTEVFMSAASPGVIAVFLAEPVLPERRGVHRRARRRDEDRVRRDPRAGLLLQLDCPDLAMGWNGPASAARMEEFRRGRPRVAAINHATRDIPPEAMRLHLCWGNYEGPHNRDVPLASIIDVVLKARPPAISFEGANPRHEHEWQRVRGRQAARRQGPDPRRDRLDDQLRRAPGAGRPADRALRAAWSAARTSSPAATAGSPRSPARPRSSRT